MSAASSARHLFCEAWSPAAGPPCDPFHYGMRSGPSCALLPWGQPTGRSKPAWNKGLERGPLRGCGHNASPSIRTGPVSPQLFWKDGGKKGQALRTQPSAEETEQRPGGNASVIHQTGFTEPRESPSCKVGLLGAAAEGWRPAEEGGDLGSPAQALWAQDSFIQSAAPGGRTPNHPISCPQHFCKYPRIDGLLYFLVINSILNHHSRRRVSWLLSRSAQNNVIDGAADLLHGTRGCCA